MYVLRGLYVKQQCIWLYVIGAKNGGVKRGPIEKQMTFYYRYFVYRTWEYSLFCHQFIEYIDTCYPISMHKMMSIGR